MKFIALLLVIFCGVFYLFGSEEKERVETIASVAGSPGFARATMDGITKTSGKRGDSYRVHFRYVVDGMAYRTSTSSTDASGAAKYTAEPVVEVAYGTRKPSVSTLRRYYDLRTSGRVSEARCFSPVFSRWLSLCPSPWALRGPWGGCAARKKLAD